MKTQATLPFHCFIEEGARYHEPLAHHDGVPLASIIQDVDGNFFFGLAVYDEDWEWALCVVPVSQADIERLTVPDEEYPHDTMRLYRSIMLPCDGYYLWELLGDREEGDDRIEYFAGPVPAAFMPDDPDKTKD